MVEKVDKFNAGVLFREVIIFNSPLVIISTCFLFAFSFMIIGVSESFFILNRILLIGIGMLIFSLMLVIAPNTIYSNIRIINEGDDL
jgi:hypothetical protein